MIENLKNISNIALPISQSEIYGNVDGLSMQNLYYTQTGVFPSVYLFDYESRTNGDYKFDTKKILKHLKNTYDPKDININPYYTKILGKDGEDSLKLGICVIIKGINIYARFESSVSDSYVLFDNNHIEEFEQFIEGILQYYIPPANEENLCWRICSKQGGYYLEKNSIKCPSSFDINKQYNDSIIKEDEKICKFIEKENESGLVILHGEKGTGKSTYIKHLIKKYPNKKFVYVPANLIELLGEPSFGSFLTSLNNNIIILEDCENVIRDRKSITGSAAAVSLLLNMTDGILADDLGMKFICTFNEDTKAIDPALLRKGRLVSRYEFKCLDIPKATELLRERGIEAKLTKPLSLAEVFYYGEDDYETTKKSII